VGPPILAAAALSRRLRETATATRQLRSPPKQQNLRKIGDCLLCPEARLVLGENPLAFDAAWTERAAQFFARSTQARSVFIPIVARPPCWAAKFSGSRPFEAASPVSHSCLIGRRTLHMIDHPIRERNNFAPQLQSKQVLKRIHQRIDTREKLGTAYSVPRRSQCSAKTRLLRRRVDRAGSPPFFAPSTQARSVFILIVASPPCRAANFGGSRPFKAASWAFDGAQLAVGRSTRSTPQYVRGTISLLSCSPILKLIHQRIDTREKLGAAYSVPRRSQCSAKTRLLRRRVDRAGCPPFFAPSTQARSIFIPMVASPPCRAANFGGSRPFKAASWAFDGA
jgi:hypothetical protein